MSETGLLIMAKHDRGEDQQKLLDLLCKYLKEHFGCYTAILYGSRAQGD